MLGVLVLVGEELEHHEGPDAGQELLLGERLGDEVGDALGLRPHLLGRRRHSGQHHDGQQARRRVRANRLEHLVAAAVRKVEVEQDEVRRFGADPGQAVLGGGRLLDRVPDRAEQAPEQAPDVLVVFDDENAGGV